MEGLLHFNNKASSFYFSQEHYYFILQKPHEKAMCQVVLDRACHFLFLAPVPPYVASFDGSLTAVQAYLFSSSPDMSWPATDAVLFAGASFLMGCYSFLALHAPSTYIGMECRGPLRHKTDHTCYITLPHWRKAGLLCGKTEIGMFRRYKCSGLWRKADIGFVFLNLGGWLNGKRYRRAKLFVKLRYDPSDLGRY